ncbi:MAG: alginate export family protein [Kiritimatiellales bacterium]|nr:alginate export family protein [Kiritimatiellales bacterium]
MDRRILIRVKSIVILTVLFATPFLRANDGTASGWDEIYHAIKSPAEKLDIAAALRLRYEHQENFNAKQYGAESRDDLLLERLWLDFNYRFTKEARLFLRLQDAHFWSGEFTDDDFFPACPYQNPLDVREAYLELKHLAGTPVGIKAGRQIIVYGDGRVWGPGNWSNSGKYTWDAAKLGWDSAVVSIDTIYAQRVIADPDRFDREHYDFHAGGVYATIKNLPCAWDLFYLLKYNSQDDILKGEDGLGQLALNTIGTRIKGSAFNWLDLQGTIAGQFGDWGADRIQAFGATASLGHTFDAACHPGMALGYTYASGDSDPNDGVHETFDPMFGAAAKYYGKMNLFSWKNLHDYEIDFTLKPTGRLDLELAYHAFWLAEPSDAWYGCTGAAMRRDKTGASGTEMGQEIDLTGHYTLSKHAKLEGGYAHFFSGDFISNTGADNDADWLYLQTTLVF